MNILQSLLSMVKLNGLLIFFFLPILTKVRIVLILFFLTSLSKYTLINTNINLFYLFAMSDNMQ